MTGPGRRRPDVSPVVRVVAGAAALAIVVGTLLPWTTTFDPTTGFDDHPAWTSGAVAVVGAVVAVVGMAALVAVLCSSGRRPVAFAVLSASVAVAGTTVLLVDRYDRFAAITVLVLPQGYVNDDRRDPFVEALPPPEVWLLSGVLAALAVTVVVVASVRAAGAKRMAAAAADEADAAARRVPRAVGVAGLVGAVLVVAGASVLPWDVAPSVHTPVLWRTDVENALGAVLLVLAGVVLSAATVRRAGRAVFALAAAAAATGTGLALPSRLPIPWADQTHGLASARTRDGSVVDLPARWHFDVATGSVLVGALAVLLAAAVAVWRAPAAPGDGYFVPAASSGRSWV